MTQQLSLLELLEKPRLDALFKPDQIYESDDGEFLVRLTEDNRYDRKSARIDANGLAICLSAFGNGPSVAGGVVAVGIEKDGKVTGCKSLSEGRLQTIEKSGRDMCVDGRFETKRVDVKNAHGEADFIILIRIHYVESRLVSLANGEAYCRQGDASRRLTDTEKQEIRISKGERSFELEPSTLDYPDDFRSPDILNFASRIKRVRDASTELSNETILEAMRLGKIVNGRFHPNNVCALMFAKDVRQTFPGAYVHFLRYNGTHAGSGSAYNVVKDRIIEGTIRYHIRSIIDIRC